MEDKQKEDKQNAAASQGSFEQTLMRELRAGNVDKDRLQEMVNAVSAIQRAGLKGIKVFPRGIPVPDGIRIAGTIDASNAEKLLGLVARTPNFSGLLYFPYGIPWPEIYRINLDLGAPIQEQAFRGV
jgi:hypothetical protein